jgi:hypothetical protein
VSGAFRGRYLTMWHRKRLRTRRGGNGWDVERGSTQGNRERGRRKRPHPTSSLPPPSGGGYLRGREGVPVGAGVVWMGAGTLASPWQKGEDAHGSRTRATHNTRRPLPSSQPPPPLRDESASLLVSTKPPRISPPGLGASPARTFH